MTRWSRSRSPAVARPARACSRSSRRRRDPGPLASATVPKASATSASVSVADVAAGAAGRPRTFSTRGSEAANGRPLRYVTARSRSSAGRSRRYDATTRRFSRRPGLPATWARRVTRSERSAMGDHGLPRRRSPRSAGDGALGGVGHGDGVLVKDAARVAGLGRLPLREPLLHLRRGDLDVDTPLLHVDVDHVAALHRGDRAPLRRLGHDVRHHEAVARAREAPVGHESHRVAQARALERAGDVEHLTHARSALRPLIADDDDVVGLDPAFLDGLEGTFLALEDPRGTAMLGLALAGELDHAAAGGKVAAQDDDAARWLERLLQRLDHLLARRLGGGRDFLADGAARDRLLAGVDETRLDQALADHGHAARLVHLRRRV